MLVFILFLALAAAGIGFTAWAIFGKTPDAEKYRGKDYGPMPRAAKAGIGAALLFLSMITIFFGGYSPVPVRSLGIPVSFGKVEPALQPGFHWVWPWVSVNEINKTVHTIAFKSTGTGVTVSSAPGNVTGPCLSVRIGGQQSACADITVVWQVTDQGAPVLFEDYNGQGGDIMDSVANNLIVREEEQVINQVMGDYQPIQDVAATTNGAASQFSTFGPKIKHQMQADLGHLVQIRAVILPFMNYDPSTQNRLNQIQAQYANTAIATQQIKTNAAQSLANAAITKSSALSGPVLEYQCLSITQEAVKAGAQLPAGWNCFGSSSSLALSTTGK